MTIKKKKQKVKNNFSSVLKNRWNIYRIFLNLLPSDKPLLIKKLNRSRSDYANYIKEYIPTLSEN